MNDPLPCLFDRLVDEAPGRKEEPESCRGIGLAEYKQAVMRDLRWLLNAPQHVPGHASMPIHEFEDAEKSVLNYGTRDLSGMTSDSLDVLQVEAGLRRSIELFEPRFDKNSLDVRLVQSDSMDGGKIAFEIQGRLWTKGQASAVFFRTELDLETGICDVVEQS